MDAVPTILDVVCRVTGMRFAAVARVTEDRWVACGILDTIDFGLRPGGEMKIETTLCKEVRNSREPVVINNVAEDDIYCGHPTPAMYGFQSYIAMPIIRRDGEMFGTLCAIDPSPARLKNPETIGMFRLFAELIASHLDAGEQLTAARTELDRERSLAELREQFVAVLGHDLRNPVAALDSGIKMLLRSPIEGRAREIVTMMQGSALRMRGLLDNVVDLARARLGGGFSLDVTRDRPLHPVLEQVIAEFRAIHPDRRIEAEFALTEPVACDHVRLAQLFSNLLGNALAHGAADSPVRVGAAAPDGSFELWVSNRGPAIPASALENLFEPFFRGSARVAQQGLGLGLYIAAEIARAHGGALVAASGADETRFTFTMPLQGA